MFKRIYIDNYKSLVNFELKLDSINLFLGPNGTGKTSVFEVLRKLQQFISGDRKVLPLFRAADLTRWQTSPIQTFELEIEGNEGLYKYELAIEHRQDIRGEARVKYERLLFDNRPLAEFETPPGEIQLYNDRHNEGPRFSFDWTQSAVAFPPPRHDNTRLIWFRERMTRLLIGQINPIGMRSDSHEEETQPSQSMENFVSWYRFISQDQGKAFEITDILKEVLEGFVHFKFEQTGEEQRILKLRFEGENSPIDYRFNELSDGQRTLIALYTLIYYARSQDYTLCIDEPENFLALPEIQPWLTTLYDFCSDDELQAILISHHPELIDYLAASAGYWFDRESNRPVRVKRIAGETEGGLPISELAARGWLDV